MLSAHETNGDSQFENWLDDPNNTGGSTNFGNYVNPEAQRALAEAEARRAAIDARAEEIRREREINGRGGLEPVRYDDWEVKGLATDF